MILSAKKTLKNFNVYTSFVLEIFETLPRYYELPNNKKMYKWGKIHWQLFLFWAIPYQRKFNFNKLSNFL